MTIVILTMNANLHVAKTIRVHTLSFACRSAQQTKIAIQPAALLDSVQGRQRVRGRNITGTTATTRLSVRAIFATKTSALCTIPF